MRRSFVCLTSLALGVCGLAQADLNDGLIAYYPFNGNANDESGNNNHFTVRGAPNYVKSPIRLSNATVAVCNQWGIGNIASFIDHVQGMGFEVQEINEPADVDVVNLLTDDQHQELLGEIQDKINERGLLSVYVKNAGGQLRYVFLDIERDPNDSDCWYFVAKLEVAGASALVADDEESILDYIEGISDDLDDQYPAVGFDPEDMSDLLVRVIPAE